MIDLLAKQIMQSRHINPKLDLELMECELVDYLTSIQSKPLPPGMTLRGYLLKNGRWWVLHRLKRLARLSREDSLEGLAESSGMPIDKLPALAGLVVQPDDTLEVDEARETLKRRLGLTLAILRGHKPLWHQAVVLHSKGFIPPTKTRATHSLRLQKGLAWLRANLQVADLRDLR